jgi:hypothetical protein
MSIHGVQLVAGKTTYTLRYDFNAICDAETRAGRELLLMGDHNTQMPTLARLFIAGQLTTARLLLWAGLQHMEKPPELKASGSIMQEYVNDGGTVPGLLKKIDEAMKLAGFETTAGLMGEAVAEQDLGKRTEVVEDAVASGN